MHIGIFACALPMLHEPTENKQEGGVEIVQFALWPCQCVTVWKGKFFYNISIYTHMYSSKYIYVTPWHPTPFSYVSLVSFLYFFFIYLSDVCILSSFYSYIVATDGPQSCTFVNWNISYWWFSRVDSNIEFWKVLLSIRAYLASGGHGAQLCPRSS